MISRIHVACTVLVLIIGLVHTAGTFFFYDDLSEAAVWFAGAGLCGIFISFLNLGLHAKGVSRTMWRMATIGNVAFCIWLLIGLLASLNPATMIIAGIGCVMAATAFPLRSH